MDDKELTELAAKAAGVTIKYNYIGTQDARCPWKPLEDDGEALRLAVTCGITVGVIQGASFCDYRGKMFREIHGEDPLAATRRAIVRAAAALVTPNV